MSKTTALVEIGNDGHRNAYMRLFTGALLELGHQVICLIPDTRPIRDWVLEHYPDLSEHVLFVPTPFRRELIPVLGKYQERIDVLYNWRLVHQRLSQVEKDLNLQVGLVYFNFLDAYLVNRVPVFLLDRIFPRKWSGLFFFPATVSLHPDLSDHPPRLSHKDNFFLSENCSGICLLNNHIAGKYSRRIGKPVIRFPDIADDTPPDPDNPIARTIRAQANGRIVVGTVGMESHKCGYELVQLAKHADPGKFFFAFTGPLFDSFLQYYPEEQAKEILHFKANLPENCYWQTERIPDQVGDAAYNAVINAFDILWVMYKNFYGSSNRLTKAAIFKKFVLSTDQYCIGENVSAFGLGETVSSLEIPALLNALARLRARIEHKDLPADNWARYAALQNFDVLKNKFRELLAYSDETTPQ